MIKVKNAFKECDLEQISLNFFSGVWKLEEPNKLEFIRIPINKNLQVKYKDVSNKWHDVEEYDVEKKDECIDVYFYAIDIISEIKIDNLDSTTQMQAFKRKYPYLIISTRNDGMGGRMWAMLNNMFIAHKLNIKPGFIWNEWNDTSSICVHGPEKYFNTEFLNTFYYKNIAKPAHKYAFDFDTTMGNILKIEPYYSFGFRSASTAVLYEVENFSSVEEKEYIDFFKKQWKEIGFSDNIKYVLEYINKLVEKIGEFVVLHLRNGDSVASYRNFFVRGVVNARFFPAELAVDVVQKYLNNGVKILIFSPDEMGKMVKQHFNCDKNIILENELDVSVDEINIDIFNITLMSKAKEIICVRRSMYSHLASLIGGVKLIQLPAIYSPLEQVEIIMKYGGKIKTNNVFLSISYIYVYLQLKNISKTGSADLVLMENSLKKALEFDPNNMGISIELFGFLVSKNYILQADFLIKELLFNGRIHHMISLYFERTSWGVVYENHMNYILKKSDKLLNFPFASLVPAMLYHYIGKLPQAMKFYRQSLSIPKNIFDVEAVLRPLSIDYKLGLLTEKYERKQVDAFWSIQNQLTYRLGKSLIDNSKSIWGYVKMPYALSCIAVSYMKYIKDDKERLLKVEKLSDYKKVKNYFSYKIGEAFIRGCKTWYKGGLIKFIFEAQKIRKEYKKK